MNAHPNATVAGGTTGVGVGVVYLLGLLGVHLTPELGGVIAGGAATVILWIGRNGIAGLWHRLVHGAQPPAPPLPPAA